MTEPPEPAGAVAEPLFMVNPGDPRKWVIAARALRDRIVSGKLKPGDQLPQRAPLAAELGGGRAGGEYGNAGSRNSGAGRLRGALAQLPGSVVGGPGAMAARAPGARAPGGSCPPPGRPALTAVPSQPERPERERPAAPVVVMPPGHRPMLTADECATMARVGKMTIYRLIHAGVVEATRVGRNLRVFEDSWKAYLFEESWKAYLSTPAATSNPGGEEARPVSASPTARLSLLEEAAGTAPRPPSGAKGSAQSAHRTGGHQAARCSS